MSSLKNKRPFKFKQFEIYQDKTAMKIGTDGVLLGAWADVSSAQNILDIGTGTGVIAIMAAQRNPKSKIYAVEIDKNAFLQAKSNIENCRWKNRIEIHHDSIQVFSDDSKIKFDAVLSNPPFFTNGTPPPSDSRTNARHTKQLSPTELIHSVEKILSEHGIFSIIQPTHEGTQIIEIAKSYHLFCTKMVKVKSKKDKPTERLLLQFEKEKKERTISELTIQFEQRNNYTPEYIELTKAFYLNM